jgi:dTDP-4-dehydrorhamnose 3,5-epimerase
MIEGVIITPLDVIDTIGGHVLHGMTSTDQGFSGFGEAYFSIVKPGSIKAWKRHHLMTLNLIVPVGEIRFVIFDDRLCSPSTNQFQKIILSRSKNYCRLTVPPMVWLGFQGCDLNANILLNIASIEHSPSEVDRKELNKIDYDWDKG